MIDKFKNSSIGQMLIAAFVFASVTAGSIIWFYESIRIPTLASQLAFQENMAKNLEDTVIKEKEKTKELVTSIENEKIESVKYRTSAKQTLDELSQVGEKLRQSQEKEVRITKELSAAKMDLLKFESQKTEVNNSPNGVEINFEEAVLSAADKEDAAFLTIDNYVSDLRLISYSMLTQEINEIQSEIMTIKSVDALTKLFTDILEKSISYRDFTIKLERLRVHARRRILDHYRQKLKKFEHNSSDTFLSDIRQQTLILTGLEEFVKKLKSSENLENWHINATKSIDEFINTNSVLSNQSLEK